MAHSRRTPRNTTTRSDSNPEDDATAHFWRGFIQCCLIELHAALVIAHALRVPLYE
jgi:hypothetical protein